MSTSPHTLKQALETARAEHRHPTEDWEGMCQRFVRTCWGIPPLFSSAWAQWLGADDEDKHIGGDPSKAPVGAALCYKGSGPFGHIMLAANNGKAWSNDLVREGGIDYVDRNAPWSHWGQKYLGYLTAVNGYDLQFRVEQPPKPKLAPTPRIDRAIDRLRAARKSARERGAHEDARAIGVEISHLRDLREALRS